MNTGATLVPTSVEEVLEVFRVGASDNHEGVRSALEPASQNLLPYWVYRSDGMATKRIIELAMQMAGEE